MSAEKNDKKIKSKLHPRNRYREAYNFDLLKESCPELSPFVKINKYGDESIDFFDPIAVKILNKALLREHYNIDYWDFPTNYLCPPIPGRSDYILYVADLLASINKGNIPTGNRISCLDIGVGANCIYPIIGTMEYDWSFIGSDVDAISLQSAKKIVDSNTNLKGNIELRLQRNFLDIFKNIIYPDEHFDLTVCNPPFHSSAKEANSVSKRKLKNLKANKGNKTVLNFGGQSNELWCDGGEEKFLSKMILQSKDYAASVFWFTSLVSKEANLKSVYRKLKEVGAKTVETIPMATGNKKSRIIAWTFLSKKEIDKWKLIKWKEGA